MSVQIGTVQTFKDVKADKEQVKKISEECMEVYSAWEDLQYACRGRDDAIAECDHIEARKRLISEIADVIQATCNLLAALGVDDMRGIMLTCMAKNQQRGREYANDSSSADYNDTPTDTREQFAEILMALAAECSCMGDGIVRHFEPEDVQGDVDALMCVVERDYVRRKHYYDCETCEQLKMYERINNNQKATIADLRKWLERSKETNRTIKKQNKKYRAQLRKLNDDCELWRGKCGAMLDVAQEIQRIGDITNDEPMF